MHFLEWKGFLYFDSNFIELCSWGFNWQWASIGSGNGLALNRDEITYPFPNFSNANKVWEWISNFSSHYIQHVTYVCIHTWISMLGWNLSHVNQRGFWWLEAQSRLPRYSVSPIYRGRMLDPIFWPPISLISRTRRPRVQFFAKSR